MARPHVVNVPENNLEGNLFKGIALTFRVLRGRITTNNG